MSLQIVVTNAGRAALVAAANDGTNAVRISQVGVSATAIVASPTTAALPGEVKRLGTISGDAVADDTIHIMVRDESNDVYSTRSIALYLQDGTLFASYGQAGVIAEKSAQAMLLLAIDVRFADIDSAMITFGVANFLNPPSTVDTAGVVELATTAEAVTGTDDQRAVTPKGLSAAINDKLGSFGPDIWRASNDGAGSGLDADLLDGQQGNYYTNIPARLGYTPLNKAGDTATGVINFGSAATPGGYVAYLGTATDTRLGVNVNGSTVGIVQGVAASFNIAAIGDAALALSTNGNFRLTISSAGLVNVPGTLQRAGNQVWDSGNDGAGSGLDADLLDGRQAAEFALLAGATFTGHLNASGHLYIATALQEDNPLIASNTNSLGYGPYFRGGGTGGRYLASFNDFTGANVMTLVSSGMSLAAGLSATTGAFSGAITRAGNQVWDAGNDGAGSGLDADMLDGLHGSYYSDVYARLGYRPVQQGTGIGQLLNTIKMGWSAASRLKVSVDTVDLGNVVFDSQVSDVWRASNDGAGSGLDADLLDGRQAAEFSLLTGANFSGGVMAAGLKATGTTIAGGTGVEIAFSTYGIVQSYDRTAASFKDLVLTGANVSVNPVGGTVGIGGAVNATGAITRSGLPVWDAGNDGSGSGLDADLLDGRHASDFALQSDFAHSFSGSGYQKLPGGLILQWVAGSNDTPGTETSQVVTLPITFPSASLHIAVTTRIFGNTNLGDAFYQLISADASSVTVMRQKSANGNDTVSTAPQILAIGY